MNNSDPEQPGMSHYDVRSRADVLVWAYLIVAIGSVSFVLPSAADTGKPSPVGIAFGLLSLGFGIWMTRTVCSIQLRPDGLVEFRRAIGTTAIPARDIRMLEGKLVSGYDGKEWKLFVQHANGTVKIDEFANARLFADRVQALDPRVGITGTWPMGPPEALTRDRRVPP